MPTGRSVRSCSAIWAARLRAAVEAPGVRARANRDCGLLPLPNGERGGVRGLRSKVWSPLTPALSPLGRGSPAVPRSQAAPQYTRRTDARFSALVISCDRVPRFFLGGMLHERWA